MPVHENDCFSTRVTFRSASLINVHRIIKDIVVAYDSLWYLLGKPHGKILVSNPKWCNNDMQLLAGAACDVTIGSREKNRWKQVLRLYTDNTIRPGLFSLATQHLTQMSVWPPPLIDIFWNIRYKVVVWSKVASDPPFLPAWAERAPFLKDAVTEKTLTRASILPGVVRLCD